VALLPSYTAVSAYGAVQAYDPEPGYSLTPMSLVSGASPKVEPVVATVPYQPFAMIPKISAGVLAPPTQRYTASVWLFSLVPLLLTVISIALSYGPAGLYTRFSQGGLAVLAITAMVMLAIRDRRELTVAGHRSTASPAWIALTPIAYLLARAVVVKKQTRVSATGPLLIGIFVIAVIVSWALLQPSSLAQILAAAPV
jgi:lysylphosphatidylglycerol synthetase-like protein (DUF2156 family)